MANKSQKKLISIALMVIGIGMLIWGYQMSGSVGSQLSKTFTGSFTDNVMLMFIGGAVSLAVGLYMYRK